MPNEELWVAIIPSVILVLGALGAGVRWVSKVNKTMDDYREYMLGEKTRVSERKAAEELAARNTENIAELTKNVDRLVRLQDDFFSKRKETI